jgi:hypothetical protein
MATAHAYATLVADDNTGHAAAVATIGIGALASELSGPLQQGNPAAFLAAVAAINSQDGDLGLEVRQLTDWPVQQFQQLQQAQQFQQARDRLAGHLAAVLSTNRLDEAVTAWNHPLGPDNQWTGLAVALLDATVLAEHSDPEAVKAATEIGKAATAAAGSVVVTAIAVHAGVAVLIAGPIGVVALGAGAVFLTLHRFTRKPKPKKA